MSQETTSRKEERFQHQDYPTSQRQESPEVKFPIPDIQVRSACHNPEKEVQHGTRHWYHRKFRFCASLGATWKTKADRVIVPLQISN